MSRKLKDGLKNFAWNLTIIVFLGFVISKVILGNSISNEEPCMCPACRTEHMMYGVPQSTNLIDRMTKKSSTKPDIVIELDTIIP